MVFHWLTNAKRKNQILCPFEGLIILNSLSSSPCLMFRNLYCLLNILLFRHFVDLRSLDLLHFYIFISFVHAFSVSYAWTCNIITNALYFPCLFEQWTEYQMSHVLLAISAYIWYSFYDRIKLPFKLNDRWDKYSKIPLAVKKTEACF